MAFPARVVTSRHCIVAIPSKFAEKPPPSPRPTLAVNDAFVVATRRVAATYLYIRLFADFLHILALTKPLGKETPFVNDAVVTAVTKFILRSGSSVCGFHGFSLVYFAGRRKGDGRITDKSFPCARGCTKMNLITKWTLSKWTFIRGKQHVM